MEEAEVHSWKCLKHPGPAGVGSGGRGKILVSKVFPTSDFLNPPEFTGASVPVPPLTCVHDYVTFIP